MIDRVETLDGADRQRLGMLLFIASEAVYFAMLILAFVYYRGAWAGRPSGADRLDIGLTSIFTTFLLASSLTIWFSERSLRRGNPAGMRRWLLATIVLGAVFLGGQAFEYAELVREGVTPASGLFGTTFFTLTGFHGLHVLGGLIALAILLGLAQAGVRAFQGPHSTALEATSIYWHFVDVVWIAVFTIVYLWTLISR